MSSIDEMLTLQKEMISLIKAIAELGKQYKAVLGEYSDVAQIHKRRSELWAQVEETIEIREGDHPPYTGDHEPQYLENKVRAKIIVGCPDCDRILRQYGFLEITTERHELGGRIEQARATMSRFQGVRSELTEVIKKINQLAGNLGLPAYTATEQSPIIIKVHRATIEMPNGDVLLANGRVIQYSIKGKTYGAAFDNGGRQVLYNSGSGKWQRTSPEQAGSTWQQRVAGAVAAAQVIINVVSGSSDTSQLADYQQLQNEKRMEQGPSDASRQSAYESSRSSEERPK